MDKKMFLDYGLEKPRAVVFGCWVTNEIKNSGIMDILIVSVDGLNGFNEIISEN